MRNTWFAVGIAFLVIGIAGQRVFLILGLVFLAMALSGRVRSPRRNR